MSKKDKTHRGLVVSDLSKSWSEHKVLDAVSFEQALGTIYGVAGDNGAGKSTLLKILASVLPRNGGRVNFQGISIDQISRWRALTGYVPQDLALDERLKVEETLYFWAAARGFSRSERRHFLELASQDPLISGFLEKTIRECSGGMARRVSLIVGLLGDPLLILLDEPFAGADQHSRDLILERLNLLRQRGRTILISSHEKDILESLCDRVLYLEKAELSDATPIKVS